VPAILTREEQEQVRLEQVRLEQVRLEQVRSALA